MKAKKLICANNEFFPKGNEVLTISDEENLSNNLEPKPASPSQASEITSLSIQLANNEEEVMGHGEKLKKLEPVLLTESKFLQILSFIHFKV